MHYNGDYCESNKTQEHMLHDYNGDMHYRDMHYMVICIIMVIIVRAIKLKSTCYMTIMAICIFHTNKLEYSILTGVTFIKTAS